ncbi:ADP-heptose:LPS heptosyltransferase [alpha proteobacterium HIMB114]|nr:ADP-heptose:LPS heptosyltransferase [alpha proteobacterium HIMB114]
MSNILIIKHGSLGDIVQISGALQDIRNQFKDSTIFILTTFKFKNLFEECPFIDEVIVDKRLPRWNFFYLLKLIKNIRSFNFEICFDLQNSSRTNFYRKNFKIKNWSSSLTVLQKDETKKQFDQEGVIERFKVQLDRSNINDTSHVLKPDFSWAIEESFQIKEQKYIFLAPFSSPKLKHKVWPYFKELIELLKNELPQYELITAPGPSEIGQCKDIGLKMILNNDKPTSICQLAKVIKQSSFVIANDTGPAHIAAHLGCKGVALFGHHTSAKKVSIETEKFKVIESNSLREITPQQVLKFVKDKIFT